MPIIKRIPLKRDDGYTIDERWALLSEISIYVFQLIERNSSIDTDYQSSTDTLSGYWTIAENLLSFTPDMYYSIEQKSLYGGKATMEYFYTYIKLIC